MKVRFQSPKSVAAERPQIESQIPFASWELYLTYRQAI